jgi:hypothetical protein
MKTFCTLLTALLVLAFTQVTNAQTYVNAAATGNNDGTSWADAYTELATALDNYSAGDEIWVAAGTYLPGQPSAWPGDPENTFYIYQDLKLYGGFNGTETMLSERDPAANITTLSGDLNGDDVVDDFETNREDNAFNVVFVDTVITAATFIDGFTIRNGHAEGDTAIIHQTLGGGIIAWGSPQIGQCRFTQNFANVAGGLYLRDATSAEASVTNCVFENNEAMEAGGGMTVVTFDSSKVVPISGCQFIGNRSVRLGGGLAVGSSSVELNNCEFTQNTNEGFGGGFIFIVFEDSGSDYQFSMTDCDFDENVSSLGGGFYYETNSDGNNNIHITSCNFTGNQAVVSPEIESPNGGAIRFLYYGEDNTSLDSITISDCVFQGNTAGGVGGGITFWNGQGTDNYLEISNSTFTENSSVTFGGGIHFSTYGGDHMEVNITECAFENNSSTDGGGVVFFTTNGEYNDFNVTSCDFTGNQATDMNTGETPDGGGIYVNFQAPGDILQFNTVTVEDCNLLGNSAQQRGGGILVFDNIGNDNSVAINNCQISGNTSGEGGGGLFLGNFGGTDFEVHISESDFTNNSSNHGGASYYFSNNGDNNNLLFSDCNFTGNTAITSPNFQFPDGGALGFQYTGGNPTNDTIFLDNCVLENNTAERYGGGIAFFNNYGTDNHMEISNCEIAGNAAGTISEGGGMAMTEGATTSSVLIRNTHFSANTAEEVQGFYVLNFPGDEPSENSHVELLNCLFTDHNPNSGNPALVLTVTAAQNAKYIMTNCTIADNDCSAIALYASEKDTKLTLQNTILQSGSFSDLFLVPGPANSEVQSLGGNLVGGGTLDAFLNNNDQSGADPLFEAGTYQLSQNSPAVDAGTLPDNPPATDLAGNDRIQGGCIDIGAYESPYDAGTSCLTDTWEVPAAPSTILIYPNPVVATASISIENEWNGELNLRIVNALGQVVHTTTFEQYSKETAVEFDAGNLPEGLYRVMVSDGQLIAVGSFVRL